MYPDGGSYSGEVSKGVLHGIGELKLSNGFGYAGKFENGKRHGTGRFYIQNQSYSLEGVYENDEPMLEANKVLFELNSPVLEEEPVDPKAKKDPKAPKKDAPFTEEEEAKYGDKKILLECKSDAEPKEIRFKLKMVYQGPDYEDPNPPEEDEKAKAKKGKKDAPDEPEVRMITPEPIALDQECGRVFAVELGQHVKVLLADKREEAAQMKEGGQEIPEDFYETKWVRFYTDQRLKPAINITNVQSSRDSVEDVEHSIEEQKFSSRSPLEPSYPTPTEDMIAKFKSDAGVAEVGELTFRLDPEFRAGSYLMVCKDVTPGLPPRMQMRHTKILVKIVDLDPPPEEEETSKAPAKAAKGKKK